MRCLDRLKRRLMNIRKRGTTSTAPLVKDHIDVDTEIPYGAKLGPEPNKEQNVLPNPAITESPYVSIQLQPTTQLVHCVSPQQRLWNVAYDSLEEDNGTKKLVQAYMDTLMKVLGAGPGINNVSTMDMKDPHKRQSLMAKLVKEGRTRLDNGSKITKGVARIAETVLCFKPMVDLLVQNINQAVPAALPWAGVCSVLQILSNPAKASTSNLEGITYVVQKMEWYCTLGDRFLETYDPNDAVLRQLEDKVINLYKALLRYQMKSVCSYYRSHGFTWLRDMAVLDDWNGYLKDVTDAEKSFEKAIQQYGKLRDSERWNALLKQGAELQSLIGDTHQTLQNFMDQQKTASRVDKDNECLRQLCLVDPHDYMKKIEKSKDKLLDKVYDWVLRTDEYAAFTNWSDVNTGSSGSLMWIKGHAGTGKTMLLMGIIRQLSDQSVIYTPSVSHFFCQGHNKALSSATAILRSLIWLLLVQQPHLLRHLRSQYDITGSSLFEGDVAFISLSNVFNRMLKDQDLWPVYFIVDALDECGHDRKELLGLMNDSIRLSNRVKWLVSSRPSVQLNTIGIGRHLIELDTQRLQDPVKIFINDKLDGLRDREGYTHDTLEKIREEVIGRAGNTFLWVALAFKELDVEDEHLNRLHGGYAIETIQKMPPGLSKLYAHILSNIEKGPLKDPQYCKAVLASAVLARRPLTLPELAIAADLPDGFDPDTIVGKCGSFLTIEDESVKLIHKSATDFLLEEASSVIFPLGAEEMHYSIFLRSLRFMKQTLRRDIYELRVPGYPIEQVRLPNPDPLAAARYTCIHWVDHLCDSSSIQKLKIDLNHDGELGCFFLNKFLQWLEALSLMRKLPEGVKAMEKLQGMIMSHLREPQGLVHDARLFILSLKDGIELAPLQAYASALIFSPTNSLMKQAFNREYPDWMELKPKVATDWNACLQTIDAHKDKDDYIVSVAFSFDGTKLASASNHEIKVWDATSGNCLQIHRDNNVETNSVCFSPDNQKLAAGSSDGDIRIWDANSGDCLPRLGGHGDSVVSASFSHNSQRVVSSSRDKTVKIWDANSGRCLLTLVGHDDSVNSVCFSANDKQVASGSSDRTIKIWDATSGKCLKTFIGHGDSVNSLVFIPATSQVASGSDDESIKIWDIVSGICVHTFKGHGRCVKTVSTSMSGLHIASGADDANVKIWNTISGDCVRTLGGHGYRVRSVAYSRDGERLASGLGDCSIKIWDTTPGNDLTAPEGVGDWENAMAFSSDGRRNVSGSDDGTIKIWDAISGDLLHRIRASDNWVTSLAFSMDNRRIASGPKEGRVKIWDADTGECLRELEEGTGEYSESVAFSNNAQWLASGTRGEVSAVEIWDVKSGKCEWKLKGHCSWIKSVAFSSDSHRVASASDDRTVRIWDVTSGQLLRTLKGHSHCVRAVCFSLDDKQVISGTEDKTLNIWDATTGTRIQKASLDFEARYLSFDPKNKSRLLTDRGVLTLEPSSPLYDFKRYGFGVDADSTWITHGDNNLFWIPRDYRAIDLRVVGRTIVIGTATSRVLIMRLAPNAGCA